jgi:hypothetical protein
MTEVPDVRDVRREAHNPTGTRPGTETPITPSPGPGTAIFDYLRTALDALEQVNNMVIPLTRLDAFNGAALIAARAAWEEAMKEHNEQTH